MNPPAPVMQILSLPAGLCRVLGVGVCLGVSSVFSACSSHQPAHSHQIHSSEQAGREGEREAGCVCLHACTSEVGCPDVWTRTQLRATVPTGVL